MRRRAWRPRVGAFVAVALVAIAVAKALDSGPSATVLSRFTGEAAHGPLHVLEGHAARVLNVHDHDMQELIHSGMARCT